ncbi:hypothetical protein [Persicobacter psychrovividus]|uniref:Outer membrane protein beta-barrel domain-containing protein n=1 Tax=Persicobacter psychrovividus TaxID=387638 RepID=A0ABN6LA27_9BACT|nr:hypothetical protein PEPS_04670 [Persicobacter psychrovividus]
MTNIWLTALLCSMCFLAFPASAQEQQAPKTGDIQLLNENFSRFRKKGKIHSSIAFSFNTKHAQNQDQLIQQVLDQNKYDFSVEPLVGYFLKDNFSLGFALKYERGINERTIIGDPDDRFLQTASQSYRLTGFMRNYLPLDGKGRFALYNQTNLYYEHGQRLNVTTTDMNISKSVNNYYEVGLGIQPGMVAFITKGFALEVSVGLLGFNLSKEEERINYEEITEVTTSSFDYRLSLLELNIGVALYF